MRRSADDVSSLLQDQVNRKRGGEEERIAEMCPQETNRILRKLYPSIRERENKITLPRRWDVSQTSSYLEISRNGLTVSFKKDASLQGDNDPSGVVRADAHIPQSIGLYYFEIKVVHGHRGCMGIGLSKEGGDLNRMPGWDPSCYGYHGDDGNFFNSSGNGTPYGPKFGTGDVIGCGIDTMLYQIFFTKNGKHLGIAFSGTEPFEELFPTVGLKTPGEQLQVNFGQKPFLFDFENYSKIQNRDRRIVLEKARMPENIGEHMDRVVSSFLGNSGAFNTLRLFKTISDQNADQNDFLEHRREIIDMIMNATHGAVIQDRIEKYFPGCLEHDHRVQLILNCLRYIDLANTLHEPPSSFRISIRENDQFLSPEPRHRHKQNNQTTGITNKRNRQNIHNSQAFPSTTRRMSSNKIPDKCLDDLKTHEQFTDEDTGEEMIEIDGIMITKHMYIELHSNDQINQLLYIMKMGREIFRLSKKVKLTDEERQILEISTTMILVGRPLQKDPLSTALRRYIANLVILMIDKNTIVVTETSTGNDKKVYSELRGMFIGWKGLHRDAVAQGHSSAALACMKHLVVHPSDFEGKDVDRSDEPMEEDDINTSLENEHIVDNN